MGINFSVVLVAIGLKQGIFRLDIRETFFTMRVMKHWNRLPREVEDAPYLETSEDRLEGLRAT